MQIGLALENPAMARTIFYQTFLDYVISNPRYVTDFANRPDTVIFPQEEYAPYFNWPHYHERGNVLVRNYRGDLDIHEDWSNYLWRFVKRPGTKCVLNMQKVNRLSKLGAGVKDLFVADINLRTGDRRINQRTISMPALPLNVGTPSAHERRWLATFRGARSHPCRQVLASLHNGSDIYCELLDSTPYQRLIDQSQGIRDASYGDLLSDSVFAFIPRGDALFSYRLLEAMSVGCIPVIFADDWVLPFDRSVHWPDISLHVDEANIPQVPGMLRAVPGSTIRLMQRKVVENYQLFFSSPQVIFESMFRELEVILPFCESVQRPST